MTLGPLTHLHKLPSSRLTSLPAVSQELMGNCTDFQEWMTSLVFPSGCGLMTVNGAQAAGGRGLPWRASSPLGPCGHLLPGDGAIHGPRPLRTRSEPSLQRIMVVLPMGLVLQRTLTPPPSLEAHSLFLTDDHLREQRSASVCWARRPPLLRALLHACWGPGSSMQKLQALRKGMAHRPGERGWGETSTGGGGEEGRVGRHRKGAGRFLSQCLSARRSNQSLLKEINSE